MPGRDEKGRFVAGSDYVRKMSARALASRWNLTLEEDDNMSKKLEKQLSELEHSQEGANNPKTVAALKAIAAALPKKK